MLAGVVVVVVVVVAGVVVGASGRPLVSLGSDMAGSGRRRSIYLSSRRGGVGSMRGSSGDAADKEEGWFQIREYGRQLRASGHCRETCRGRAQGGDDRHRQDREMN